MQQETRVIRGPDLEIPENLVEQRRRDAHPENQEGHRQREYAQRLTPALARAGLAAWAFVARRPKLYDIATRIAVKVLALLAGRKGRLRWLPFAGAWTDGPSK